MPYLLHCCYDVSLQGCNRTSLQCVPLYDTLGDKAIEYVLGHSEAKFVVAAGAKLAGLAKSLKGVKGQLLGVAYWGEAPQEAQNVSCCCCWSCSSAHAS